MTKFYWYNLQIKVFIGTFLLLYFEIQMILINLIFSNERMKKQQFAEVKKVVSTHKKTDFLEDHYFFWRKTHGQQKRKS